MTSRLGSTKRGVCRELVVFGPAGPRALRRGFARRRLRRDAPLRGCDTMGMERLRQNGPLNLGPAQSSCAYRTSIKPITPAEHPAQAPAGRRLLGIESMRLSEAQQRALERALQHARQLSSSMSIREISFAHRGGPCCSIRLTCEHGGGVDVAFATEKAAFGPFRLGTTEVRGDWVKIDRRYDGSQTTSPIGRGNLRVSIDRVDCPPGADNAVIALRVSGRWPTLFARKFEHSARVEVTGTDVALTVPLHRGCQLELDGGFIWNHTPRIRVRHRSVAPPRDVLSHEKSTCWQFTPNGFGDFHTALK
jgi:hypothetical protein